MINDLSKESNKTAVKRDAVFIQKGTIGISDPVLCVSHRKCTRDIALLNNVKGQQTQQISK